MTMIISNAPPPAPPAMAATGNASGVSDGAGVCCTPVP